MDKPTAADYATGLRALADLIENNPELPLPNYLSHVNVWYAHTVETFRAIGFAAARAKLPIEKQYTEYNANLQIACGPITVRALALRETVCERVLVGTDTEIVEEPDPEAPLVTIPDPTVTKRVERTVERYEWRCAPVDAIDPEKRELEAADR